MGLTESKPRKRSNGGKKQLPPQQQRYFTFPENGGIKPPPRVDLRSTTCFPYLPADDQGSEGSCVSFALAGAVECAQRRHRAALDLSIEPSAKSHFDTAFGQAAGSNFFRNPEEGITFSEALAAADPSINSYWLVPTLDNLRRSLYAGYPFMFGFAVTERMRDWQNGDKHVQQLTDYTLPKYNPNVDKIAGFHSALAVGYDDQRNSFLVRNSWGKNWGDNGHFWMPYETMVNEDITKDVVVVDLIPTAAAAAIN